MMRKNIVLPYRFIRSSSSAVRAGDWHRNDIQSGDASWLLNGSAIEDWSYDTPVKIGREIKFDAELLLEELGFSDSNALFEIIHIVKISSLRFRKILHREVISLSQNHLSQFTATLDSNELCEELILVSLLVLKENTHGTSTCSPSARGMICWSDETRIVLEGSGSRFPMQELQFSKHHRLPGTATWHLEWRPALLHYSFNSAVTLMLNSEQKDFFERIQGGDEVVIQQMMSSITGEICSHLLEDEDFASEDIDYPDGSLGYVVRSWLFQSMPGKSLSDIRATYRQSPALLHTALRGLTARI